MGGELSYKNGGDFKSIPLENNYILYVSYIKRDIIFELAKYAQEHTDINLNPDDYSKFGRKQ